MWPLDRTPGPLGRTWGAAAPAGFSPLDIAGCQLWLAADALVGLVDDDPVATWADASPAGNDVTAAGAARPLYKTGILNSLPIVRFDGSANTLTRTGVTMAGATGLTFVAVVKLSVETSYPMVLVFVDTVHEFRYHGTHNYFLVDGGGGVDSGVAVSLTLFYIVIGRYVATTGATTLRINGGSDVTATAGTSSSFSGNLSVGSRSGSFFLTGDIAEVIAYNSSISDENVTALQTYLNTKYAIY